MKILWAITMAAMIASANACAGEITPIAEHKVIVCVSAPGNDFVLLRAESIAEGMFASVGVRIEWRHGRSCPAIGIMISFSGQTGQHVLPGALAFAMPYEGTHIRVFYDRIQAHMPHLVPYLLAHVMVHEITHVLQGIPRHSESGVMKPAWDMTDFNEMPFKPLPFAQTDVQLIRQGLDARELRIAMVSSIH
jgi:hypothetical protein